MIFRALFSQGLATAFVAGVSMLLLLFLARTLGPEDFGIYNYVLTVAALLAMIQDGGFRNLLMRERAAITPRLLDLSPNLLRLGLGHLVLLTCALQLAIWILPFDFKEALAAAVFCYALITAGQFVSSEMKGLGEFPREAAWQITCRSMTALSVLMAVTLLGPAAEWIFLAWAGGLVLAFTLFPGQLLQRPLFQLHGLIYRSAIAFMVIDMATTIYFRIDIVMLNHLQDDPEQLGYYSAAYRVLEALIMLLTPAAQIFFREIRVRLEDRRAVRTAVSTALWVMLGLASATVLFGVSFASEIVSLFFGDAFAQSSSLLSWMLLAIFFVMPNYVLTQGAIALNKEQYYAWAACVAAICNVVLNALWIPAYGALGAAWATLATEAALTVLLLGGMARWLTVKV